MTHIFKCIFFFVNENEKDKTKTKNSDQLVSLVLGCVQIDYQQCVYWCSKIIIKKHYLLVNKTFSIFIVY